MAKILVADDNSNIQKMVGLALKDQGIEVVAVGNGEAAVRKISDLRPDLVLADVFMPVRSGYEVCSYVKQDPTLAHIPVILLVGAFDPLDEQEAQRVGADGVLKKPFVPPDPLISMVKSALARAGVSLEGPSKKEKPTETFKRHAAELLSPAASKLAALAPAKLPEPEPEPEAEPETSPEDLPSFVTEVRIEGGQQPVAFGSLLETPEAEDESAFLPPKPVTELAAQHQFGADEPEEEEEEVEESKAHGWRPGGDLDKALDEPAISKAPADWREEAFHGDSPAKPHRSQRWAPSVEEPAFAEAHGSTAVAVSTLEVVKPLETPAFSGDAWAAAMAAGVEEKPDAGQAAAVELHAESISQQSEPATHSFNGTHVNPWEVEAKKATLLASTWDAVAPQSADNSNTSVADVPSAAGEPSGETVQAMPAHTETLQPETVEPASSTESPESERAQEAAQESQAPAFHHVEPQKNPNETQEIEAYSEPVNTQHENSWVAATPETVHQFVETPAHPFAQESAQESAYAAEQLAEAKPHPEHTPGASSAPTALPEHVSQPNMDELVARVLSRMNPDILQKVTRDILKPVIEAIVQDELNSQKH